MSYGRSRTVGPVEAAIHGAVAYLALSIGLVITAVLGVYLVGGDSTVAFTETDDELFFAVLSGFELILTFSIVLAFAFAVLYAAMDQSSPAFIPAAIATAVGTLLAGLLLLVLVIVLEPDGFDIGFVDELLTIVVVTIGSVLTAVLSGLGFELV